MSLQSFDTIFLKINNCSGLSLDKAVSLYSFWGPIFFTTVKVTVIRDQGAPPPPSASVTRGLERVWRHREPPRPLADSPAAAAAVAGQQRTSLHRLSSALSHRGTTLA
jgi:hypothetical protein